MEIRRPWDTRVHDLVLDWFLYVSYDNGYVHDHDLTWYDVSTS